MIVNTIRKREAALQFSNSILGWTVTKIVRAVADEVRQRGTIEELSRANEERKLNPAT